MGEAFFIFGVDVKFFICTGELVSKEFVDGWEIFFIFRIGKFGSYDCFWFIMEGEFGIWNL